MKITPKVDDARFKRRLDQQLKDQPRKDIEKKKKNLR